MKVLLMFWNEWVSDLFVPCNVILLSFLETEIFYLDNTRMLTVRFRVFKRNSSNRLFSFIYFLVTSWVWGSWERGTVDIDSGSMRQSRFHRRITTPASPPKKTRRQLESSWKSNVTFPQRVTQRSIGELGPPKLQVTSEFSFRAGSTENRLKLNWKTVTKLNGISS